MSETGEEWVECRCSERHWGRHGAAGMLIVAGKEVLLQHRASWSAHGGTWGIPGGARRDGEAALSAALRETEEETGLPGSAPQPGPVFEVNHGDWSYTTILATAPRLPAYAADAESDAIEWVAIDKVDALPLLPAFAAAWPLLRAALGLRTAVVIDAANVVGSRPFPGRSGSWAKDAVPWWRDRAGATGQLRDRVARWSRHAVAEAALPPAVQRPGLSGRYVVPILVVEGAARSMKDSSNAEHPDAGHLDAGHVDVGHVDVVRAAGSGDDTLAALALARRADGFEVIVVTADRELTERVTAVGAYIAKPSWLLALLDAAELTEA